MISFVLAITAMMAAQAIAVQAAEPAVVTAVAPVYPTLAFQSRTAGRVAVKVTIGSAGKVDSVAILEGDRLFHDASERAARQWKFADAPVNSRIATLIFVFSIVSGEPAPEDLASIFRPPYEIEVRRERAQPTVTSDPPGFSTKRFPKPDKKD